MFRRILKAAVVAVSGFLRRLVVQKPGNDYEGILFDALYAAGARARREMA